MACGAPVIDSCGSSTGEIVGPAGVLVEPASEEELAGALEELLDDEAKRFRLAAAGLARAAQFQWAEAARLTRESYLEAILGSGRRSAAGAAEVPL